MERRSINYALALAMLLMGATSHPAAAATLTYELQLVDAGNGGGTATEPWIRAVFSSFGSDKVLLNIQATDWMFPGQFIRHFGFNHDLDTSVTVLPCNSELCSGIDYGTAPLPTVMAPGSIPPGGTFSFVFTFPTAKGPNRFEPNEYGKYLLSAAGLVVQSFDAYSEPGKKQSAFKSYAQVQGHGGIPKIFDNTPTYSITDEHVGAHVPEPGVTLLVGSGLLTVALLTRRSRRR